MQKRLSALARKVASVRTIDMQTFVVLTRTRHFGRAAAELNTTQPAVSARLNALEAQYGCTLINRADRSFSLTEEGEQVLAAFEDVLGKLSGLEATLRHGPAPKRAPLRIGCIDSVSSTWMPHLVDSLHEKYPDLKIELTVDGTYPLGQGLKQGKFDIIFGIQPIVNDGFRSFTACVLQMVWTGSARLIDPDRVYATAELAELPIISFPKDSPPYQMIAPYFHDEQVLASKLTSCNSLYAIINLLVDGFGIGAIPAVSIRRELSSGLLQRMRTTKRFPAMPIVGTYQALTDQEFIRAVVEESRRAISEFCAATDPEMVWME